MRTILALMLLLASAGAASATGATVAVPVGDAYVVASAEARCPPDCAPPECPPDCLLLAAQVHVYRESNGVHGAQTAPACRDGSAPRDDGLCRDGSRPQDGDERLVAGPNVIIVWPGLT